MKNAALQSLVEPTVEQVRRWLDATSKQSTKKRSAGERRLAALLASPIGLDFAVRFVDRVVKSEDLNVAARELFKLSKKVPTTLSALDRITIRLGGLLAPAFSFIVIPIARARMRQLVGHLVADARPAQLKKHISAAHADGHTLNLNLLGEAVLGEREALDRFEKTFELLKRPEVSYVSVKVSAIASQLSLWGYQQTVDRLVERLRPMYQFAAQSSPQKFINLDMEEYRDLALTLDVFKRLLSEKELKTLSAGIVIQCYLPDSYQAVSELWVFASRRVSEGGAPLKVRVVKGANLAMEKVDAEWHGWPLATYSTKEETDANYKRVIEWLLDEERLKSLRVGIAGHNLFDIALAHLLVKRRGLTKGVEFEMLKGMASEIAEAIRPDIGAPLLYTPVVQPSEFKVAIAYLIRRLEENAASENFMSGVFDIATKQEIFEREANRFRRSVELVDSEPQRSRRKSNPETMARLSLSSSFENEPDVDPSNQFARSEIVSGIARGLSMTTHPRPMPTGIEPLTSTEQIDHVLQTASAAAHQWRSDASQRKAILLEAARQLSTRRPELIAVMVAEAGKTPTEADPELSEAIDFARFYAHQIEDLERLDSTAFEPNRVTLVVPPWNFPVAIPAGGVLGALAAGSSVVIKPAPQVPACSLEMVKALWDAGVPKDVLQIVLVEDGPLGLALVGHDLIDSVVLTGSFETAKLFVNHRPGLKLAAETSGKNSMIITPSADLDLAAADLAKSAFGHAGQKCSAASVAILVGSVARSKAFERQLLDAVASMRVGRDASSLIGPLVQPPTDKLLRALTQLDAGEQWMLEPKQLDTTGHLWSPGIRTGVKPGSFLQQNEVFGPVLAIVHAKNLKQAVQIANSVEYGLTAGIHSLDFAEVGYWRKNIQAGNLYVNRTTTGAIVERQPFGGMKRSSVGWGLKAGGKNYLLGFGGFKDEGAHLSETEWLEMARLSDVRWITERFAKLDPAADPGKLRSEANYKSYHPTPVVIRLGAGVDKEDRRVKRLMGFVERVKEISGVQLDVQVSSGSDRASRMLVNPMAGLRVIMLGEPDEQVTKLRSNPDVTIFDNSVVVDGLVTGLMLLRERSTSITTHRYGNTFEVPLG
jgi:RHH-type proline utilization regulon transcriptional repressor/proline dehydrogenase/delta 1-pyrroline-5-carboxylate dehydrogenase